MADRTLEGLAQDVIDKRQARDETIQGAIENTLTGLSGPSEKVDAMLEADRSYTEALGTYLAARPVSPVNPEVAADDPEAAAALEVAEAERIATETEARTASVEASR